MQCAQRSTVGEDATALWQRLWSAEGWNLGGWECTRHWGAQQWQGAIARQELTPAEIRRSAGRL